MWGVESELMVISRFDLRAERYERTLFSMEEILEVDRREGIINFNSRL